jgi:hypothetical protein
VVGAKSVSVTNAHIKVLKARHLRQLRCGACGAEGGAGIAYNSVFDTMRDKDEFFYCYKLIITVN